MGWLRKLGWVIGGTLVVAAIVVGFLPSPVLVDTATVQRGAFEVTVREEGKTRVVERYVVSAPVAAYARRLEFDIGDAVGEGEVLLHLEPSRSGILDPRARAEAEARVAAAAAALLVARQEVDAADADFRYAEADRDRIRQLHERGATSQTALDIAETSAARTAARLEAARRGVEVAEYEVAAAETALRYSAAPDVGGETIPVRSPVTGRVLNLLRESEGAVAAGQPLLEVGDPALLEVEVEVLSSDAVKIAPGTPVRLERWGGQAALDGVVRVVEPVGFTKISALGVEEQRVRVIVDFVSPPGDWSRLGDQYRVDAVFIVWRAADVMHLPTSALFRHGDGWATFVIADQRATLRPVTVGQRSGLTAEIHSGVDVGDVVIVHPDGAITDGSPVEVVR